MRAWTRLRSCRSGAAPAAPSAGRDVLKWVAAAFALVATATAEYDLARAIGMNEWVAAAVPGALDAYVVRALRTHREVLTAVLAMVAVNAASHLVTAGVLKVEWPLITAVSAIAPLVLWRVHALGTPGQWRARKLWGLSKDEYIEHIEHTSPEPCPECVSGTEHGVLASTEPEHTEHERAPDNPEPPGTREHPEGCVWGHSECTGDRACTVYNREHTASTDDLDVPEWVNPPSTPAVPVHAPYADPVDAGPVLLPKLYGTDPVPARHLEVVRDDPQCPVCSHRAHDLDGCYSLECACTHTARTCLDPELCTSTDPCTVCDPDEHSTRTADDWNLEHVSTGVLEPEDTEHMDRARELFHTLGGVPPYRALKEGEPGMGTPRAKRIRAALKAENEGTD